MESAVDALVSYRDHFFELHPISEASNKSARVKERLDQCLIQLNQLESNVSSNSLFLRGKALNVLPEYDPEAEILLAKAVKLQPNLVEAWNELGESYWKKGKVEEAKNCFEGALKHKVNKISLRNLSIVMRQKSSSSSSSPEENFRNIEQSLEKAKEAVQLDTSDGMSWSILGNAYLMHYFSISQNPRTLKQAMSAYKQAEKDAIAAASPELHYNKAVALRYEEDYSLAVTTFERASALDPTWDKPDRQKRSLIHTLKDVRTLIDTKGKLKTKRFNQLVESIKPDKSLGPFMASNFELLNFADLKEGINAGKVVLGKVICSIHSESTFCLTDRSGRSVAVNLYNLAPGKGVIIGDSVAIAEPHFAKIKLECKQKDDDVLRVEFELIRVDSPLVLVINGKKASRDLEAGVELSTFTKTD